jgi:hypothetical protein
MGSSDVTPVYFTDPVPETDWRYPAQFFVFTSPLAVTLSHLYDLPIKLVPNTDLGVEFTAQLNRSGEREILFKFDWEVGSYEIRKATNAVGLVPVTLLLALADQRSVTLSIYASVVSKVGVPIGKPALLEMPIECFNSS